MFEFLYAFLSVFFYGSVSTFSKYVIKKVGHRRAAVYIYIFLSSLLLLYAFLTSHNLYLPPNLLAPYFLQISVGALAVIVHYKTLERGKVAEISPITRVSTLLVVILSIVFLNEVITAMQVLGALLIVISAFIISDNFNIKKEWLPLALTTMILRTIYFTNIKLFVVELGPLASTILLEVGNSTLITLYYVIRKKNIKPYPDVKYALIPALLIFLGSLFYNISVSFIGAGITSAISGTVTVIGAIMSYIVLKEKIEKRKYAAIIAMAIGIALLFIG